MTTAVIETTVTPAVASGTEIFIPLNKLKKHPKNARKTPHSEASIEAKAASIHAKGILQNLVVEPELDAESQPTGFYLVSIGEGRRLAQLLRVKRKQIKKTESIRCVIDTQNDPSEISLDENVTREDLHPADQFERFRELAENRGWGAEEIAARFGVSAHVVRQRMRLGAVSPKLMQVYRDGGLTLDQLTAFVIVEDHARQEQVYENLSYNRDPSTIRRDLTRSHVAATDRRAIFVGPAAYTEAGGAILRDLFTEDRGGFYEDVALLDRLAIEKLERIAADVHAEGWKWASAHIDYPHSHGLRRNYPQPVELSAEDEAAYGAVQAEFNALSEQYESAEELPDDVDERFGALEAEIERIDALRHAYDPDDIARGGVFVVLNHDGTARIERGFIRAEDEKPEPAVEAEAEPYGDGYSVTEDLQAKQDRHRLLLMLDEFPALGRLDFFESALAFMAGYGLKSFLIAQSLNQIEKAYGPNNSILDNCHVRVSFATNDERTAKRVSDALGTATEMRAMKNYAGHRLSPWLGHLMVSRSETARQLLTPGEIMQLPPSDEIVMIAGIAPIRAKKARYYEDARFKERILSPPELWPRADVSSDAWSTLPIPLQPIAATGSDAPQQDDEDPTESEHRLQPELNRVKPVEKKEPIENEFEIDPNDDGDDDDAVRNRRLTRLMQGVARQVSLDPNDGMEL